MSYKPEFKTVNGPGWYGNNLAFATKEEAEKSASITFYNWSICTGYQVVESTQPVNYRFDGDTLVHVPENKDGS